MNPFEKKLPKPAKTPRICLKCDKEFQSTGPGNRICPGCSHTQSSSPRCESQGSSMQAKSGKSGERVEGFT